MLQTPISVKSIAKDGKEHLEMWVNGECLVVPAPIRPYLMSRQQMDLTGDFTEERVIRKPLDTLEDTEFWRYSFPVVDNIRHINKQLDKFFTHDSKHTVFENHVPFIERVAIDEPDFYTKYPEKLKRKLVFDIETLTVNHVDKGSIIAISVSNGKEITCFIGDEKQILLQFIAYWKKTDPDIVITYNGKEFDLPRVIMRCHHHGIPTDWIGRDGDETWQDSDTGRVHRIVGRLNYDVWEAVDGDQGLFGIKSRGLKSVARWFGMEVIEEETFNTIELLNDIPRLINYCNSDVRLTEAIAESYLAKDVAIANLLKFPIDEIVNPRGAKHGKKGDIMGRARSGFDTLVGRLVTQRGMFLNDFIEAGQNKTRYPEIYNTKKKAVQGAEPELFQQGRFEDILHADFAGMYPSIQMSVNISPETVKLLRLDPYDTTKHIIEESTDTHTIFCIPDRNLCGTGRNAIIFVDQSRTGAIPEFLFKAKEQRQEFKDIRDAAKDEATRRMYGSLQLGVKVIMNGIGFGVNVPIVVRYGSSPVAILITGIARYMIKFAIDWMEARGYSAIEVDTDGCYFINNPDFDENDTIEALNAAISEEVANWGIRPEMKMEAALYKVGWWYKTKNYVLRDMAGDLKVKGGAMKGSKLPPFIDKVRDKLAEMRFDGATDKEVTPVLRDLMKIKNYSFKDLTINIRNSKHVDDYVSNTIGKQVALLAQKELGIVPNAYTIYSYIHGKKGIRLAANSTMDDINLLKYRDMVITMAENFGWGHIARLYRRGHAFSVTEMRR